MTVTVTGKVRRNGRVYTVSASGADSQAVEGLIAELETSTGRTTPPAGEHLARVERVELEPGAVRIAFAIVDASANAIRNLMAFDRVRFNSWVSGEIWQMWERGDPPEYDFSGGVRRAIRCWSDAVGIIFRVKTSAGGLVREYVRCEGRAKPLLERTI